MKVYAAALPVIPFVEQLQVEMAFNTNNRGDAPTDEPGMYSIAQMLFEKNSTVAEAMMTEFEESPKYGVMPFSIVLGENMAWINIDLLGKPVGVRSEVGAAVGSTEDVMTYAGNSLVYRYI